MGTGVVIPDADPVADAGQIDRGFARVDGFACQPGGHFSLRIRDDVSAAINRRHPGDRLSREAIPVGLCAIFLAIAGDRPSAPWVIVCMGSAAVIG